MKKVPIAIVGGGPAGLMAAEVITGAGHEVHLFDAMPSLGRKFLMAGKSGLNLTHGEEYDNFLDRYAGRRDCLRPYLDQFTPEEIRRWAEGLGIETFEGSSHRVFPKEMKAAPLLRAWVRRLRAAGLKTHVRHRWVGWDQSDNLCFETEAGVKRVKAEATVLALGGASWTRLGSDGRWRDILMARQIDVPEFQPSNCGFDVNWSDHFRDRFAGEAIKSVELSVGDKRVKGDFVISKTGVEGSAVYTISSALRDKLQADGQGTITLDLRPDRSEERLRADLAKPQGSRSFSGHLKRTTGLAGVKAGLFYEFVAKDDMANPGKLAAIIKNLAVPVVAPRPLDEAISTAGGLDFSELDDHLMIRNLPGVFAAGEMLDWDAPTGGYLLTACLATGRAAGAGAVNWAAKI